MSNYEIYDPFFSKTAHTILKTFVEWCHAMQVAITLKDRVLQFSMKFFLPGFPSAFRDNTFMTSKKTD